ncbi:hypothetical protein ACWKYF_05590 [Enterobacter asburiae]
MFVLYDSWDFSQHATFSDIEKIVSPQRGLELACYYYELDYTKYSGTSFYDIPKKSGMETDISQKNIDEKELDNMTQFIKKLRIIC